MRDKLEKEFKYCIRDEITYKNILGFLENKFNRKKSVILDNYFFDTEDFSIWKVKHILRLRREKNRFTVTLKGELSSDPDKGYSIREEIEEEVNNRYSEKMMNNSLSYNELPFKIKENLNKHIIEKSCVLIMWGSFVTKRDIYYLNNMSLNIDKVYYSSRIDYELEIEIEKQIEDVDYIIKEIREKTKSKLIPLSITKTERLKNITEECNF